MRRIELDFVRGPRRLQPLGVALLAAGALLAGVVGFRTAALNSQLAALSATLNEADASARRRVVEPSAADAAALARSLVQANQVAASLNLGWPTLFRQLETLRVPGVTLIAIQPESGSGTRRFRVTGEALQLEAAFVYVTQLAATPGFANVHLASHEVLADRGGAMVQFVAVVDWLPA